MFKRQYLTAVLVLLSLAAGSAVATAAEAGIKTTPDSSIHAIAFRHDPRPLYGHRGLYDYAGPQAGYGWYDGIPIPGAPGMATIEVANEKF